MPKPTVSAQEILEILILSSESKGSNVNNTIPLEQEFLGLFKGGSLCYTIFLL